MEKNKRAAHPTTTTGRYEKNGTMSFSKGHKRRPTSIATDEIMRSSMSNVYVTPAGQVLQSSMVKNGSPSKRQLAGSTSQVRFALPADNPASSFSSEYSDEDDVSHDSFLSEEDWEDMDENNTEDDSFSRKQIVNMTNKTVIEPPSGRSGRSKDRISVGNSMRVLVSTSPERNKLFVRPHSDLNRLPIPIPVEAQLPPPLSPKNKGRSRPTSLIYNGVDYEPLGKEFLTGKYLKTKLKNRDNSLPPTPRASAPSSPTRTPTRSKIQKIEQVPISREPLKETNGIIIPDLSKPIESTTLFSPGRYALDNENEIKNPSPAAKKLNNQLNKRFSFPPRQQGEQIPSNGTVLKPSNDAEVKSLPPVPQPSQRLDIKAAPPAPAPEGLQIYNFQGQLQKSPAHEQQRNAYGRFGASPQRRSLPADIEQREQPVSKPIQFHQHRRSKSQAIDFQVEAADIIERQQAPPQSQQPLSRSPIRAHNRRESLEVSAQSNVKPLVKEPLSTPKSLEESTQPLQVRKSIRELPPNPPQFQKPQLNSIPHEDSFSSIQDSIQDSIQESIQYSMQDSIQDSIQDSTQEESNIGNDDTQLFDLGDLIMSSAGPLKLTPQEIDRMDESIAAQSHIYDEPLVKSVSQPVVESHESSDYAVSLEYSTNEEHNEQPLGSHLQPQPVFMRDNVEADHIRSASRQINLSLHKHVSSPLMSHSSYESEAMSEAFSNTGSDKTVDTVYSNEPREIVDLTHELEGMRLKPGAGGRRQDHSTPNESDIPKRQDSILIKELDNGDFQETIILDSDEEGDLPKLSIRHKRSKSNATDGSRAFSAFSFETIASEVQMRLSSDDSTRSVTPRSLSSTREVRRYGSKRKSVIEMCEETMKSTREVMDDLKRQKTILLSRRKKLMEEAGNDQTKLAGIKELQKELQQVKRRETLLKKAHRIQPSTASSVKSGEVSDYFDYQNSQSYDFQTFMRSKSDVSLVEMRGP